jgi:hypothetical protein
MSRHGVDFVSLMEFWWVVESEVSDQLWLSFSWAKLDNFFNKNLEKKV